MRFRTIFVMMVLVLLAATALAFEPLFYARIDYGAGDGPSSVFAVDLDGDGDNDLAVANSSSANVSVLLNNGDGTFHAAVNYGAGDRPHSVFAVDLDGDSDSDLAVTNTQSGRVSILINLSNTTGVDNSPERYLPGSFGISQNYPNPFNARTTVKFSLAETMNVKLQVFDIAGRLVEVLAEGEYPAGENSVIWDAGERCSGVYFVRLASNAGSEVKKMILLK